MRHNRQQRQLGKQRGNTLVIAVFVIVVLGGLVAVLSSLLRTTSESVVTEVLGARSYLAAQSGLEQAMLEVYPLNNDPVTNCSFDGTSYSFAGNQGLQQCNVAISCDSQNYTDADSETFTHLVVTSTAVCEAGSQRASRQLQIETRVGN
ncbi:MULTISPECIES: Type II secretory pathway component [Idiomarina]|uniref:Type II secretory pathway component n=1 Tax=Idiomarina TaxID=135575 RepID=UPI000C3AF137|nr:MULTISPECIES: Type II secretory pathway component [Idiomarina]MBP58609.1 Type II secretory pathway component [Idiomarina sp.]|tara:strand:- start:2041 stop:2487 length:447 start_codon:yes stop_codon:yes gene_type:complete